MKSKFNKLFNTIICELVQTQTDYHVEIITNNQMGEIIASHVIENNNKNMNNDFTNLKKLLFDDQMMWYLLKDNINKITACAACRKEDFNSLFINQLFSFQKGCGAVLLNYLLNNLNQYNIIYLNSDWSDITGKLNQYYRQNKFNLTEYIANRDHYDVHYFYKNIKLTAKMLKQFIEEMFI